MNRFTGYPIRTIVLIEPIKSKTTDNIILHERDIKARFTYVFKSWRRLFLFNLIVKTIQKYFARPYNP